jgi:FlaA1/EpsC-like NDP-sugar epimerase
MSLVGWAGVAGITAATLGVVLFVNRNHSIDKKFKNKRIVITGASAGLGAAIAERLATVEGVKVVLAARREEKLKQVQVSAIRKS